MTVWMDNPITGMRWICDAVATWYEQHHTQVESLAWFTSLTVFFGIVAIMFGILIVLMVVPLKTPMQRAWRSKIIAFNLILWRSAIYRIINQKPDDYPVLELIFWTIAGLLIYHFALHFYLNWIEPILPRRFRALGMNRRLRRWASRKG